MTPTRRTQPKSKADSPLAVAHHNLWAAFNSMIRQRDDRACFTCGKSVTSGKPMAAGHYKPAEFFEAVKYDPYNAHELCDECNLGLGGNPHAYAIALEKRYAFGILQILERRSNFHFEYTVPLLEKLTAAAKKGPSEYFILYESVRPKEEREVVKPVAQAA